MAKSRKPQRKDAKKSAAALVKKHKTIRPDLSLAEIRFCQHYAKSNNATQAFIAAEFANHPASDSAANTRAARLLRKRQIRDYIQDLRAAACESAKITTEDLARSFREQAYADRTAIFKADGSMKPPSQWPKELRSLITGLEVTTDKDGDTTYKVKFERSTEAKKILAQWRGMIGADEQLKEFAAEIASLKSELNHVKQSGTAEGVGRDSRRGASPVGGEASIDTI